MRHISSVPMECKLLLFVELLETVSVLTSHPFSFTFMTQFSALFVEIFEVKCLVAPKVQIVECCTCSSQSNFLNKPDDFLVNNTVISRLYHTPFCLAD